MKISVKYFAAIREDLGRSGQQIETSAITLGALRDELIALDAVLAVSLARGRSLRMALNQVMSDDAAALTDGAEVAFFPPVTGG
ncbi:MAG: molybdopterin synthase sulfur carrier subunit [Rhodoferax sp.]|jgi:molybdopterin synthase sulfur carrier subunit